MAPKRKPIIYSINAELYEKSHKPTSTIAMGMKNTQVAAQCWRDQVQRETSITASWLAKYDPAGTHEAQDIEALRNTVARDEQRRSDYHNPITNPELYTYLYRHGRAAALVESFDKSVRVRCGDGRGATVAEPVLQEISNDKAAADTCVVLSCADARADDGAADERCELQGLGPTRSYLRARCNAHALQERFPRGPATAAQDIGWAAREMDSKSRTSELYKPTRQLQLGAYHKPEDDDHALLFGYDLVENVTQSTTSDGRIQVEITNSSGTELPRTADAEPPCSVIFALRTSHPHLLYYRGESRCDDEPSIRGFDTALTGSGGNVGSRGNASLFTPHSHSDQNSSPTAAAATVRQPASYASQSTNRIQALSDEVWASFGVPPEPTAQVTESGSQASPLHDGGAAGAMNDPTMTRRPRLIRETIPDDVLLPGERRVLMLDVDDVDYLQDLSRQVQEQKRQLLLRQRGSQFGQLSTATVMSAGQGLGGNSHAAATTTDGGRAGQGYGRGGVGARRVVGEARSLPEPFSPAPAHMPLLYVYYERLGDEATCVDLARRWVARERRLYRVWRERFIAAVARAERGRRLRETAAAPRASECGSGEAPLSSGMSAASSTLVPAGMTNSNDGVARGSLTSSMKVIPPGVCRSLYRRIIPPVLGSTIRWRRDDRKGGSGLHGTRVDTVTDPFDVSLPLWYYYDEYTAASFANRHSSTDASLRHSLSQLSRSRRGRDGGGLSYFTLPMTYEATHSSTISKSAQKMFNKKQMGGGVVITALRVEGLVRPPLASPARHSSYTLTPATQDFTAVFDNGVLERYTSLSQPSTEHSETSEGQPREVAAQPTTGAEATVRLGHTSRVGTGVTSATQAPTNLLRRGYHDPSWVPEGPNYLDGHEDVSAAPTRVRPGRGLALLDSPVSQSSPSMYSGMTPQSLVAPAPSRPAPYAAIEASDSSLSTTETPLSSVRRTGATERQQPPIVTHVRSRPLDTFASPGTMSEGLSGQSSTDYAAPQMAPSPSLAAPPSGSVAAPGLFSPMVTASAAPVGSAAATDVMLTVNGSLTTAHGSPELVLAQGSVVAAPSPSLPPVPDSAGFTATTLTEAQTGAAGIGHADSGPFDADSLYALWQDVRRTFRGVVTQISDTIDAVRGTRDDGDDGGGGAANGELDGGLPSRMSSVASIGEPEWQGPRLPWMPNVKAYNAALRSTRPTTADNCAPSPSPPLARGRRQRRGLTVGACAQITVGILLILADCVAMLPVLLVRRYGYLIEYLEEGLGFVVNQSPAAIHSAIVFIRDTIFVESNVRLLLTFSVPFFVLTSALILLFTLWFTLTSGRDDYLLYAGAS